VQLNVGGQLFNVKLSTLSVREDNFFTALLSGRIGVVKDEQGRIYVNRSPDLFVPILHYLRTGRVTLCGQCESRGCVLWDPNTDTGTEDERQWQGVQLDSPRDRI
jgi:hypothetical protein